MANIIINDKKYEIPMGEIFINSFDKFVDNDTISIETNDKNEEYVYIKKVFDNICNNMTILGGTLDELNTEYSNEYIMLLKDMKNIDNMQNFLYKKGEVEEAINKMQDFIVLLLDLNEKMMNEEVAEKER